MSDAMTPITEEAEFLSLLPGYLNGSLGTTDTQRMEHALQQHPDWQHELAFDQIWKQAMQSHQPKLDSEQAWLMFKEQLVQAELIKRKLRCK